MFSYAQNFEDVMLNRVFGTITDGFYIDVGAWHPDVDSVTRHFYEAGWSGVNIEPAQRYHKLLTRRRIRDVNLNVGVGVQAGTATFYEVPGTGLSSFSRSVTEWTGSLGYAHRRHEVEILTLETVCDAHCKGKTIHFLKIDAEGMEGQVIQGMNWTRYRPIVVLVEAIEPETQRPVWGEWEPLLREAGYQFVWFDGINRFYIRNEDQKMLRGHFLVPPNRLDGFFVVNPLAPFCERTGIRLCGMFRRLRDWIIGKR